MTDDAPGAGRGEDGFTLVELLVAITILAIIGFTLTQAVILGIKSTDSTSNRLSSNVAAATLSSVAIGDVHGADRVSVTDSTCAVGDPGVFLHLTSTDRGVVTEVSYALSASTEGHRELVRWTCTGGGDPAPRALGRFFGRDTGPVPVTVDCDGAPCPATPGTPRAVTLHIHTDASLNPDEVTLLTVRRRTG